MAGWKLVLLAGLWPFGGDEAGDAERTIESLESQSIEIEAAMPLEHGRDLAVQNYREFLETASEDPVLRAEAMRRLADLELEAKEELRAEGELEQLELAELENALRMYEMLLESYPDYEHNDGVLYQLSRAYESIGRQDDALRALDRLIREYPDSGHLDEAHFRRGEILFLRRDFEGAEDSYAAVTAIGSRSTYYEQSLYKQGWANFKQGFYGEGAESFLTLLDVRLTPLTPPGEDVKLDVMSRPDRELIDDTLRVLAISFSYLQGAEGIQPGLQGHRAEVYGYLLYESLGDLYLVKERFTDAAETYRAFVDGNPLNRRAPDFQIRVVEAYHKGDFPTRVLAAKEVLVSEYGLDQPFWQLHDPADQPEVIARLKTNIMDLARHYHARAQQEKGAEDYAKAAHWYRRYLAYFPDDPDAPNNNYMLAEILFESGQYAEATVEYERTAYDYPTHSRGAGAGYAALVSYERHEESLLESEQEAWHRQSIESALKFARVYPDHEQALTVLTQAADDLFVLSEMELAVRVADQSIARATAADGDLLRIAWTVKAHALFDLQRFGEAELSYLALRGLLDEQDEEYEQVIERIAASIYKQGEQRRDDGDLHGAAWHFRRVAQVTPGASIRATAEYDAAAALLLAEDWQAAIPVLEGFRSDHPDHEMRFEVTRSLAVSYNEVGDWNAAASEFERIAVSEEADTGVQREALLEAADLYRRAESTAYEIRVLEGLIERFPEPLDTAMDARERLADLAEQQGDYQRQRDWLEAIVQADAAAGEARSPRSKTLAARSSLKLAMPGFEAFKATRLGTPLQDSIKAKKASMESALEAFGKAAGYGIVDVTTAATYHIAAIYHQFGRDLMAAEKPAGLSEEELEQYEILLEEQAYPFEEQAIEIHQANAARAADGVYDEWVRKSYDALAELMPVRYAKAEIGGPAIEEID